MQVPFVFFHGIGLGVFPYIPFIGRLAMSGQPVLCLEMNHVSMRWVKEVPDVDAVVHATVGALKSHGVSRVNISVSALVLQALPQILERLLCCLTSVGCVASKSPSVC